MLEYLIAGWIGVSAASAVICIRMIWKHTHKKPECPCDSCENLMQRTGGVYECEHIHYGYRYSPPEYCKYYKARKVVGVRVLTKD